MKALIHRMCTKKTYIREKIDCAPHFSAALILGGFSTARCKAQMHHAQVALSTVRSIGQQGRTGDSIASHEPGRCPRTLRLGKRLAWQSPS